jgi:hypothetical protein
MTTRARINRVLAVILVLWGGAMVLSGFTRGVPSADSAYSAGQLTAFILGFVMVAAGLWTLLRKRPS